MQMVLTLEVHTHAQGHHPIQIHLPLIGGNHHPIQIHLPLIRGNHQML
jgi:hypothetical protein